jgi:RimJ/RimL family protein N-acetyltransferase
VGFPLVTARLRITPLDAADIAAFVAYRRDPDVARWQSYNEADARDLVATQPAGPLPAPGEWLQLALRDGVTGALRGDVAVHTLPDQPHSYELGVTLARASQGRGLATEGVGAVLSFLFDEARAHRVVAFCDTRNAPVARLLVRLGMRHESRLVDADFFKGGWSTLDGYALLAREHTQLDSGRGET